MNNKKSSFKVNSFFKEQNKSSIKHAIKPAHFRNANTGYKNIRLCLLTCLLSLCPRVYLCPASSLFLVSFAMEILFLAPSNGIKKPKANMKINAKKTNSTSENTIQSSYFVLELRKLYFFKEVNLEIEIFHPRNPFHACCKFYSVY